MHVIFKVHHDLKDMKAFRLCVATKAQEKRPMVWKMDGPVRISVDTLLNRPKSTSKKIEYHVKRPGANGISAAVAVALENILYSSVSQIIEIHVCKEYSKDKKPTVEITVAVVE
jgi:Holliday junction resolvase RusA-like endonuclease